MFINRKSRSKWTETYFVRNFRYLGGNIIHADHHRAVNIRVAVGKYFIQIFMMNKTQFSLYRNWRSDRKTEQYSYEIEKWIFERGSKAPPTNVKHLIKQLKCKRKISKFSCVWF